MEVRSEAEGKQGRKSSNNLVQRNLVRAHPPKYDVQSASSLEEATACKPVVSRSMQCMEVPAIRQHGSLRKRGCDVILALETISKPLAAPRRSKTVGRFSSSSSAAATPTVAAMNKAKRRLPGSRRKRQMEAPGSSRTGFILQVVTIETGEDVVSKVATFLQQGRQAVCVLSASGVISKVIFQKETTSSETLIYEGHLGLVSLSGISLPSDSGGQCSCTGRLSVSLALLDGRVLGGVPRAMMAASPVQVIFGSFVHKDIEALDKSKHVDPTDTASTPVRAAAPVGAMGASNSTSQGAPGGFPGSPMSPVFRSTGSGNSNQQGWL